jgi:hypothetical protein
MWWSLRSMYEWHPYAERRFNRMPCHIGKIVTNLPRLLAEPLAYYSLIMARNLTNP